MLILPLLSAVKISNIKQALVQIGICYPENPVYVHKYILTIHAMVPGVAVAGSVAAPQGLDEGGGRAAPPDHVLLPLLLLHLQREPCTSAQRCQSAQPWPC